MSAELNDARRMLADNNARGMSSSLEPIHWNLHNGISALIWAVDALEEKNAELERKLAALEMFIRQRLQ